LKRIVLMTMKNNYRYRPGTFIVENVEMWKCDNEKHNMRMVIEAYRFNDYERINYRC
jgi:hypothetical protein